GFLALPYLGLHSYRNDSASGLDAGLRLGGLLGGGVNPMFSINWGITLGKSKPKNNSSRGDFNQKVDAVTFSPLFHIAATERVDFVAGPKLGFFSIDTTQSAGMGMTAMGTVSGTVAGLNAGVFFAVSGGSALGVLASAELKSADRA